MPDWHPHQPAQQQVVRAMTNRGPPGFISRRLDDMLNFHAFQPLHRQLRASKRVHGTEVLHIRRDQRSIRPHHALQATHDP
uniref:Uncharacterized protein n=1 Tax=Vitis vinifera TaxID=29760 RepID=A5BN07_VITVI|nr:hypothetical protein VITISV_019002 [Vitis vinifera]